MRVLSEEFKIIHKGNLRNNIHDENMLILDGSHNEDAGKELSSFLEKLKGKKNIYMIFNLSLIHI